EPRTCAARSVQQVDSGDAGIARGRFEQTAQHAEGGGLAGTVRPEKAVDLSGAHLEADVIGRDEIAETARQIDCAHQCGRIACAARPRPQIAASCERNLPRPPARQQTLALTRAAEELDVGVLEPRLNRLVLRASELRLTVALGDQPYARPLDDSIEHGVA